MQSASTLLIWIFRLIGALYLIEGSLSLIGWAQGKSYSFGVELIHVATGALVLLATTDFRKLKPENQHKSFEEQVERETGGHMKLEWSKYAPQKIIFHVDLLLAESQEHYYSPADAKEQGHFGAKNKCWRLAQKLFTLQGVEYLWIERYSVEVKVGQIFSSLEIAELAFPIVKEYVEYAKRLGGIDPSIRKMMDGSGE